MTARPILFSAPMVRALLEGRKTQTRRVVKPFVADAFDFMGGGPGDREAETDDVEIRWAVSHDDNDKPVPIQWCAFSSEYPEEGCIPIGKGYGQPGDLLWVRESHAIVGNVDPGFVLYRASGYEAECRRNGLENCPPEYAMRWSPSIHMPRWASRLTLRITEVRVERLHSISTEDAIAEGVEIDVPAIDASSARWVQGSVHIDRYARLWDEINGRGAWTTNPWVWALTFEVIQRNVDAP